VLRKAQDKLEGEPLVRQLSLQTWNAIAENVYDETNVFAGKTLKGKFMQKVDHMLKSMVTRCCGCDPSKDIAFPESSSFDFSRCVR
jgi:hypothetical protein